MRFSHISLGALALAIATPAFADPIPVASDTPTVSLPDSTVTLADTSVAGVDDPAPAPAPAADDPPADPPKAFTFTGGVTLVSDYRFRGLTQSDEKAAVQATTCLWRAGLRHGSNGISRFPARPSW